MAKPAPKMTELIFLTAICHLSKLQYSAEIDNLLDRKDHVDSHAFLLGFLCLLKQYPQPISRGFMEYLAQYTRSFVAENR